jgi:hypothetical protein
MFQMTTETALNTNKRFCRRLHANLKTGQVFYDPPLDVSDACELLTALDQIACECPSPPGTLAPPVHPGFQDWDATMDRVIRFMESSGYDVHPMPSPRSRHQHGITNDTSHNERQPAAS